LKAEHKHIPLGQSEGDRGILLAKGLDTGGM